MDRFREIVCYWLGYSLRTEFLRVKICDTLLFIRARWWMTMVPADSHTEGPNNLHNEPDDSAQEECPKERPEMAGADPPYNAGVDPRRNKRQNNEENNTDQMTDPLQRSTFCFHLEIRLPLQFLQVKPRVLLRVISFESLGYNHRTRTS